MTTDPLQRNHHLTAEKIYEVFEQMRVRIFPHGIAPSDFKKFLYAVQNAERRKVSSLNKGRRSRYPRQLLVPAATKLRVLLKEHFGDRVSLLYFINNCLPVIDYPPDLQTALNSATINLDVARSLARINKKNLGQDNKRKPVEIRRELLKSHLKRNGTQKELRQRINERLGVTAKAQATAISYQVAAYDLKVDALIEFHESDTEHLLWEDIKALVFLMREVDVNLIDDDVLTDMRKELENLKAKLAEFIPVTETT